METVVVVLVAIVVVIVLFGTWAWFSMSATAKQAEREHQAHRDATIRRLADQEHLGDVRAEELVSAWEAAAAARALENHTAAFWEEGERWMADPRRSEDVHPR